MKRCALSLSFSRSTLSQVVRTRSPMCVFIYIYIYIYSHKEFYICVPTVALALMHHYALHKYESQAMFRVTPKKNLQESLNIFSPMAYHMNSGTRLCKLV